MYMIRVLYFRHTEKFLLCCHECSPEAQKANKKDFIKEKYKHKYTQR